MHTDRNNRGPMSGPGTSRKAALALLIVAGGAAASGGAAAAPDRAVGAYGIPDVPADSGDSFAVMPFENRSGVGGLDWMSAAAAFSLGDKLTSHPSLVGAEAPLIVPAEREPAAADPEEVAAFGADRGARWVWTGSVDRPHWNLELRVSLWRVETRSPAFEDAPFGSVFERAAGSATRVGKVVRRGDFQELHAFMGDAIVELSRSAELPLDADIVREAYREPTGDFYAFTLFGRGLTALAGTMGEVDLDAAAANLERAVFIDPRLAAAHRVLGILELRRGEFDSARHRFARSLALREGNDVASLLGKGRAQLARGRTDRALELVSRALTMRPSSLSARYELSRVLWEVERLDEAFEQARQVVARQPEHLGARRVLVLIHASRGDRSALVSQLEAVLELAPDDDEARLDLAAAYAAAGRDDDALGVYRDVLDEEPRHLQAVKFVGDIHLRRGDVDEAIASYERALEIDPADARPYFLLGAAYVTAGEDYRASQIYDAALRRFPHHRHEAYNNLGTLAHRQSRFAEAAGHLDRAVRLAPERARYRYNLALSLSRSGRESQALEHVDVGLDLEPENAELHYLRGVVLLRQERREEAVAAFDRTLSLEPDHGRAAEHLARLDAIARGGADREIALE